MLEVASGVLPKCGECRGHVHERGNRCKEGAEPSTGMSFVLVLMHIYLCFFKRQSLTIA